MPSMELPSNVLPLIVIVLVSFSMKTFLATFKFQGVKITRLKGKTLQSNSAPAHNYTLE